MVVKHILLGVSVQYKMLGFSLTYSATDAAGNTGTLQELLVLLLHLY